MSHISAIYQPYISHISVIFQSYISHIRSCIAGHYGFKSSYGANNWYWGNKYSTVFFLEIQSHLVTNPARKYCQLDSELRSNKMFVDGRKFENRNFPRFQQVNLFKNMSPRFCSKLVFQALAAVMLTASEDGETFKTLPAKIASKFGLSSRVADDLFYSTVVGKYEQIHIHRVHNLTLKCLTISHSGPWPSLPTRTEWGFFSLCLQTRTRRDGWATAKFNIVSQSLALICHYSGGSSHELPPDRVQPLRPWSGSPW